MTSLTRGDLWGYYLPAINHKIFVKNQNLTEERLGYKNSIKTNLAGLGVVNGLIKPSE